MREVTEEDLHNSAFWHIQRFYHQFDRGRKYGKSVLDLIQEAQTPEELKALVEREWPGASSGTRRKWARAAELRYKALGG